MTKAERTRIGFPENFRNSAKFGKVNGQRGPHTYCYPKVKSVYNFDSKLIDNFQELVEQLFTLPPGKEIPERTSSRLLKLRPCLQFMISGRLNRGPAAAEEEGTST